MSKASKAAALAAIEVAAAAHVPLTDEQATMVEQALAEPDEEAEPVIAPAVVAPEVLAAPAEDLAAYAKRIECVAQPLAVCIITHPDAVDGAIFEGVYAGIRLVNGPEMSARLSDGSTI
jgi:hypothetical protein